MIMDLPYQLFIEPPRDIEAEQSRDVIEQECRDKSHRIGGSPSVDDLRFVADLVDLGFCSADFHEFMRMQDDVEFDSIATMHYFRQAPCGFRLNFEADITPEYWESAKDCFCGGYWFGPYPDKISVYIGAFLELEMDEDFEEEFDWDLDDVEGMQ